MPRSTDTTGSLEIADSSVPQQFLSKLNDSLRRVGQFVATAGTPGANGTNGANGSDASLAQVLLSTSDTLAIASDVAPVFTLPASKQFATALLYLKQAPIGGSVTLQLYVGGSTYGPQMAISGKTATASLAGLPAIAAGAIIRLDVVGVPTGGSNFPGAGLSVILR